MKQYRQAKNRHCELKTEYVPLPWKQSPLANCTGASGGCYRFQISEYIGTSCTGPTLRNALRWTGRRRAQFNFGLCSDVHRLVVRAVRRPPWERQTWLQFAPSPWIFLQIESYLWLQNWRSSGHLARRLALQGQLWDWLARCGWETLIPNFCRSVAARADVCTDPSPRYTSMLPGRLATNHTSSEFLCRICSKPNLL